MFWETPFGKQYPNASNLFQIKFYFSNFQCEIFRIKELTEKQELLKQVFFVTWAKPRVPLIYLFKPFVCVDPHLKGITALFSDYFFSQPATFDQLCTPKIRPCLNSVTTLEPVTVAVSLSISSAMRIRRINTVPDFQVKDSVNWYYTVKCNEIKSITPAIRHNEGEIISLASWTAVNLFLMILIFGSQLTTSKTS